MAIKKYHLLTPDGFKRLSEEVEFLRSVKRDEVAARLTSALEDGQDDDFVDNAELEAARNEQSFIEGRILELEEILRNHQIIESKPEEHEIVRIGTWVTIKEEGFDEEETYYLVGAAEADPSQGRISNESPLGRALLGAKVGSKVKFRAPQGETVFFIVKIG